MTDSDTLRPEALDRLREWGGEKLLGQMVRLFLENSGTRMDQIRTGVADSDPAEAEKGSHSLKSSAANLGAGRVQTLCAQIEDAATQNDLNTIAGLLPELETSYAAVIAQLEAIAKGFEDES